MTVSSQDKTIIRDLAKRVAEIAQHPSQQEKARLWSAHNSLRHTRPLVLIFPEGAWRELLPDSVLQCSDENCRRHEWDLRARLYHWEHLRDDNVIEPTVFCPIVARNTGYGLSAEATRPAEITGAYRFEPVLRTEADIEKITIPQVTIDWQATAAQEAALNDLFGGLLRIEKSGGWGGHWGFSPMDTFATWRGLDRMFLDLADRPAWVHEVMSRLLAGRLAELDAYEKQGALTLNNRNHYNGSGGVGYTDDLPQPDFDGAHIRPRDLWAMATTQIFSEVSPAMHEEFALRYERQFLARFGLANYGCCEPLHHKLEIVKKIPNLRRISISPWADVPRSAASLGDRYVFSWKPNPAVMATPAWHPDAVRRDLRTFCAQTRGCIVDIIMKDTHTCNGQPSRMWDWVRIANEVAAEFG